MRRRDVFKDKRTLLAGIMAALFGVWALGVVTREPYPAPIFPRFGSIPTPEEIQPVKVRMLAFEDGRSREVLTAAQAFDGAFDSFHPQMLNSLVSAGRRGVVADPEFEAWSRDRVGELFDWVCAQALEVIETEPDGGEPEKILARFEFEGCR